MTRITGKDTTARSAHTLPRLRLAGGVAALSFTLGLAGCHSADVSRQPPAKSTTPSFQQGVPIPPTADQISPSSPRAVLDGTSTTQTSSRTPHPSSTQPSSQQPAPQSNPTAPQ